LRSPLGRDRIMKQYDFQQLPLSEKVQVLYEDGVYVGKRKLAHLTTLLFQLDSFYVEVHYVRYRYHVTGIRCFSSTEFLDPYLKEMDVEQLVLLG
jgi:hypothetical protein